jgi:hypothetical protein
MFSWGTLQLNAMNFPIPTCDKINTSSGVKKHLILTRNLYINNSHIDTLKLSIFEFSQNPKEWEIGDNNSHDINLEYADLYECPLLSGAYNELIVDDVGYYPGCELKLQTDQFNNMHSGILTLYFSPTKRNGINNPENLNSHLIIIKIPLFAQSTNLTLTDQLEQIVSDLFAEQSIDYIENIITDEIIIPVITENS